MSRDFYRVVFCAFAICENEETLNVMGEGHVPGISVI